MIAISTWVNNTINQRWTIWIGNKVDGNLNVLYDFFLNENNFVEVNKRCSRHVLYT